LGDLGWDLGASGASGVTTFGFLLYWKNKLFKGKSGNLSFAQVPHYQWDVTLGFDGHDPFPCTVTGKAVPLRAEK
jgi:hypothetical protein